MDRGDGPKIHGFIVKPTNFDPNRKYPLTGSDSRWTTERVERQLELSLESAGVCECRLRCVCAEPAWVDWLRATVCERDQRRLGRQSLRGHHERRRGRVAA